MLDIAQKAAVRIGVKYMFWAELFYSMDIKAATPEMGIQTEATDGLTLWINEDFFGKLPLEEQTKELIHELIHKVLLHPVRRGHRDPALWNQACDHAVNNMMVDNGFSLQPDWLIDRKYQGWLAEAIYTDLQKNPPPPPDPKRQDVRTPGSGKDGTQPVSQQDIEAAKQQIMATVEKALANAAARGDMPKGIREETLKVYKPAREPWYNHMHRYMQALSSGAYDWSRLNYRTLRTHGVFSPMMLTPALRHVRILVDASGSCFTKAQQAGFLSHMNAILGECKPLRTTVDYFDTKLYEGDEYEAGTLEIDATPRGGGGTSFRHIFETDEAPDVCVVLTDMFGDFPDVAPDYPVIWADVVGQDQNPPFGEYIHVTNDVD